MIELEINQLCTSFLDSFKKKIRSYGLFQIVFLSIALLQLISLVFLAPFFEKTHFFALIFSLFFLTLFSYLVLLFYFQAKKPEEIARLQHHFFTSCAKLWHADEKKHTQMAKAIYQLLRTLQRQEYHVYFNFHPIPAFSQLVQKCSAWIHWREFHKLKESLFFLAIEEQIKEIKIEPTNPHVHRLLADTYRALAKLYICPQPSHLTPIEGWVFKHFETREMKEKFKIATARAIEELKIIDTLSPLQGWVHRDLALLYHDLGDTDKEIEAYEQLINIAAEDERSLCQLGMLYFKKGACAQGLRIYSLLKKQQAPEAEELICHYGDFFLPS